MNGIDELHFADTLIEAAVFDRQVRPVQCLVEMPEVIDKGIRITLNMASRVA